jgi:hypothetical protein
MRHTRAKVIARARREFVALNRLVSSLQDADWKRRVPRPPTRDPWTVKDALAHVVYWKENVARAMRGERRPPEMRGLDVNALNRLVYRQWRGRRPGEVVDWHRRVHTELLRGLARMPDEWFGGKERAPQWPFDLDGHSASHRTRDIEAALARATPTGRSAARARGPRGPRSSRPQAMAASARSGAGKRRGRS